MRPHAALGLLLSALSTAALASPPALTGDWREPGGSVIHIASCGSNLCATLVAIPPDAPTRFDIHNPDDSQHTHALCGLVIGHDFHPTSATHADNGTLYDPKTGKTYHGEMTVAGDQLALRGYIGIKLFGRSETWARTSTPLACHA
jgi:uncharacterized protein (DUF2147 family)